MMRCDCAGCRWSHEIVLFVLFLLMSGILSCRSTVQVMDGTTVKPEPATTPATFPMRPPADSSKRSHPWSVLIIPADLLVTRRPR